MRYKSGEKVSDSIGLLISILVRYPEMGSIKYDPQFHTLKFTFIAATIYNHDSFSRLQQKFISCLETFYFLKHQSYSKISLEKELCDKSTLLQVTRDVESLSKEEISLITEFFRSELFEVLVCDAIDSYLEEEELISHDQLIDNMLENFKGQIPQKKLIAFREEGRVLVFNK